MVTFAQLVCALLLPLGLGALLTTAAREVLTSAPRHLHRGGGGALLLFVIVVAYAACAAAIDSPLLPPRAGWFWLPWALLLGVLPVVAFALPPGWWRWCLHGVIASGAGALVLFPVSHSAHDVLISGVWIAGGVVSVLISAWVFRSTASAVATDQPLPVAEQAVAEQAAAALVGGLVAAGAAASGSKDFALLAMILPLAILGQALCGRLLVEEKVRPALWAGGNLATAFVVALTLMMNGNYSEMPWYGALPLAVALPLGGRAARLGRTARSRLFWRLGVTLAVGLVGLGLILALGQPPVAASDGPSYGY